MPQDTPGCKSADVLDRGGNGMNLLNADFHHGDVSPVRGQTTQGARTGTPSKAQFRVPRH